MPVYFIRQSDIADSVASIPFPLAHHLIHVLRHRPGDFITLIDETGKKYETQIRSVSPKQVVAPIRSETTRMITPRFSLHLGASCIKGARMDTVIEKSVELGVMRISPLMTRRVVVKFRADRVERQKQRWEAIAREAAQQSERWEIPSIDSPIELDHFLKQTEPYPLKLIFWENEISERSLRHVAPTCPPLPFKIAVLIGPEGGWEDEEVDRAKRFGYRSVSLGDRPLRADTAAITALALLQYELNG